MQHFSASVVSGGKVEGVSIVRGRRDHEDRRLSDLSAGACLGGRDAAAASLNFLDRFQGGEVAPEIDMEASVQPGRRAIRCAN